MHLPPGNAYNINDIHGTLKKMVAASFGLGENVVGEGIGIGYSQLCQVLRRRRILFF
jgi:hypothetical protein